MRFAIIEDGKVANVAISDDPFADNWIASDTAAIGDLYENGQFTPPPPDYDAQWAVVREQRNARLAASDWTQLPDAPVDASVWAEYRQALRDLPSTITGDPRIFNDWPKDPNWKPTPFGDR